MADRKIVLHLFYTFAAISSVHGTKLNVPRILLPVFNDFSAKFLLEANDGGCYKWSTNRNDLISINTIDENVDLHCSLIAEVSVRTRELARNLAVVLAEDLYTDQVLKCDVVIDVISSLSITTTTRELFMEEIPEAFQVNACDDQGNEFSTLEGVEFEWNIVSMGVHKEAEIVKYLPFKDSPYESPPHIQILEDQNKKGSIILLGGVKTGSAKVSVQLSYPEYKHVESVEVVLTVIANLLLIPSEADIMVGDLISFKLFYLRNGKMDEVQVPDIQYFLESEDKSIIVIEPGSSEVTGLQIGRSRVLLKNVNSEEDDPALKLPMAVINVVQPAYIVLTIQPYRNWAILVGDQHEIIAEVFSSTDTKLYLGAGVEIHTQVGEAFHVEHRSRNGSWTTGWGLKESRALVQAKLEAVVHPKLGRFPFETEIITQGELYIYPRITISPTEVVLPWDPQIRPTYKVDLVAKGGDGRFLWASSDHSVGLVSQTGHVRTLTKGSFDVSASMTRNHHNRQIAKFSILAPVRLEIVEFIMEAEIGQPIYLHVALYAEKELPGDNGTKTFVPFTQCQDLPFQVKQTDNKFHYNKSAIVPPVGISCGNIAMIGTAVGSTKVTITYFQEDLILEDSVTISTYNKLKMIHPVPPQKVVLAVGSSIYMVFSGGPRPQIGRQSDHQRLVVVDHETVVQAEDATDINSTPGEDNAVIWILCRKLGESNVKLVISNTPSVPNCKSHGSALTTKVICGKPRRLHIQPEIKVADSKACPMDLSADRVVVPNKQDIELDVIVQDELGRIFLNTSSLLFTWETKPAGEVRFTSIDSTLNKIEMYGTVPVANKSQQIIKPRMENGLLEVTGTVVGYKMSILNFHRITPEWPEFRTGEERVSEMPKITSTIGLFLVDDTVVTPNFTIVFNQPNVKKDISVMHGSGFLELSLSNDDVAAVTYIEGTRTIEIVPKVSGELTIQVVDLCLIANPVFIYVRVVTLGRIDVDTAAKVEINHCIPVVIKLYDQNDNLLDVSDLGTLDLRHRFSKSIANLGRMPLDGDAPWPLGEIHHILTGIELGGAQLTFTFDTRDAMVTSDPVEIQVFAPLKVNPRNGTLLVGSTLQLTLRGGPTPDMNVEFLLASANATIEVNDLGIVIGRTLGSTRITVRSVGVHPKTGEKIIFAEDTVDVNVIKINGIKISAPLTRFKLGATVPCWVTGIPEQISPLILASFEDNSIDYNWYFDEHEAASILGVFATVGVRYKSSDRTMVRIIGLQPGRSRLNVNVTFRAVDETAPIFYNAFVDIEVFEPIHLVKPTAMATRKGKSLLMARHSAVQLETNVDDCCKIEYSIPNHRLIGTEVSSVNATPTATITVTDTGYLQSYGTLGFAPLIISTIDEFGLKQSLTYVVQVKQVNHMMLTVSANWRIHLDSSLQVIPLGTDFMLTATFYDNMGNRFNAGPRQVKVRSNRLDLVRIKQFPNNASLAASMKKAGHTVIKGWTEGLDNTADYIRIHTEEVVKPIVDFLVSGDIMCLWSPVVTKHLQMGSWTSSDASLITLDPSMDIAFVIGNREGSVFLTHSLHANAPLKMQVLPVAEVSLLPQSTLFFTNGAEGSIRRIGVVLKSRAGPADKRNNLVQGWLCDRSFSRYIVPTPFRCFMTFTNQTGNVDANVVWSLKSSFQSDIGQYNCKVMSTGANASEVATLKSNVTFWAISDEGEIESAPLEIPFIPGVYVHPEVHIGDNGNIGELIVKGLDYILAQIKVEPADSSIIYVDKGRNLNAESRIYQVHLIDYHPKFADIEDSMGIRVRSPVTDQVVRVMVKVSTKYRDDMCAEKSPFIAFVKSYKHAIIIVISMLVIFCVTCYVYSHYMQPVVNVNVHPSRSLLNATGYPLAAMSSTAVARANSTRFSTSIQRGTPSFSRISSNFQRGLSFQPSASFIGQRNPDPTYGDTSFTYTQDCRRNRRFL